jgi:MoxR-like ATPase
MTAVVPRSTDWLDTRAQTLVLEASPGLRTAFTTWLREYGKANGLPGLGTGTLESRLSRLRRIRREDAVVVWTTPARWAAGAGLSMRFPELSIDVSCVLVEGTLTALDLTLSPPEAPEPQSEPGAVGAVIRTQEVAFPAIGSGKQTPLGRQLEAHFQEQAHDRWGGFVTALKEAVEAEALDLQRRQERLILPFAADQATLGSATWTLRVAGNGDVGWYEPGEWLELLGPGGAVTASARLITARPREGLLEIEATSLEHLPEQGFVRPRGRTRINEQKRSIVRELESPTGNLADLVRLVAAPELAAAPAAASHVTFINPSIARNPSQAYAVGLALGLQEGQALSIVGPPGTGKSTTAAEVNVQLVRRDPAVRVLSCSHSNHGTDNLLLKVLPFVPDPRRHVARVGAYDRVAPAARQYFATSEDALANCTMVFTTIDSLGLQNIAGARMYDYVVLDEANRAGVLDSLLALARGRRMILIGDPMQLQPVLSESVEQGARRAAGAANGHARAAETSLFAWLMERGFPEAATVFLDEQNRMHPSIASLISRVFYNGRVRSGPAAPRELASTEVIRDAVTWVDTSTLEGSREERRGTSLVNTAEARLVLQLTRHLVDAAPAGLTIGVIAAYAQQRDLLRSLLADHAVPPDRQLEVDTVDAFEGREKDIIVLSLVRANQLGAIGFLRLAQRLNVALSRARRGLIVVGDVSVLQGGYLDELVATVRDRGTLAPASGVLRLISDAR